MNPVKKKSILDDPDSLPNEEDFHSNNNQKKDIQIQPSIPKKVVNRQPSFPSTISNPAIPPPSQPHVVPKKAQVQIPVGMSTR